jgi:serine/threonine protein kinase/Tfp pilus assembly protein PilF
MMVADSDDNKANTLDEALTQFVNAYVRGEQPDLNEFVEQYPQHEAEIRQRVESLCEIDALFDSLVQADESDFQDAQTEQQLVGQKIGSFEIIEIIGRGGMGVVYLAHDTKLKRSVAIKSIPTKLTGDLTARMRFRREAELLASLNHPNIAVIHEIIEQDEGTGYLILEYVPGETLAERIARELLELEQALSISRQVAEAISAAHKKGIVHRDLKPGNIKITPDGIVKVLDFGLAKPSITDDKKGDITATELGRVIGTPAYMSPEQARGKQTDHRTDIWSFGCIIYQMLTGHLPFEGQTATDTLARIIERDPDWELLPERTPRNIRVLLRRCLEKNPDQRLGDIMEAAKEINEALSKPQTTSTAKLRIVAIITGAVAVSIVLSGVALKYISKKAIRPSGKETRLVVLPFENLGPAEDEYFASGITDAITARLATIRGLAVISRQSAMQYKKREKTAQQIANELRVDYILEGTVQRERPSDPNSRVRITPQLIKAIDDAHVWAQSYDNDMSKVFRVQSDLAEQVAQALNIALVERERQVLRSRPTENMEAYDYFLRGNEYWHRGYLESGLGIAIRMYEKAVELDPKFALAYARLSWCHAQMYWEYYDHTLERLEMARKAVDRALELEPDLPEAHWALGNYYYHGHLDYDRALKEFAVARQKLPNDSDLLSGIGYVQRRQGKFEEALANLKRACELDPLSNIAVFEVGQSFVLMRNYPEAMRCYDRAISLAPDLPNAYNWKAWLCLLWEGSIENARAVVEEAFKNISSPEEFRTGWLITLDVYEGNYQKALDGLSSLKSGDGEDQFYFIPKAMRYAEIYRYMNDNELAKKYYDEARNILEAKIQEDPNDARFRSSLGIAYAGLGLKEDAIREGKKGIDLLPITKDAWRGSYRVRDLALIYVMVGEFDLAIEQIEYLLSIPGPLSIPSLRLDPAWVPLRDHPRFKKLLESDN